MSVLHQSGVIPYRINRGKLEILLITSSSGKRWIVPKGWIALWMTSVRSAAKEAWEEAGVTGTVTHSAIGSYKTRKWGCPCQVEMHLMLVEQELETYPEAGRRKRQWLSLSKAIKRVQDVELKRLLKHMQTIQLDQISQAQSV
ncbi:NUDIX hydrolase [Oculatella sp. LEGE 06141]|uniref:NUDIX hydrolase n=1 Tax=Oculatella sp. LEGE 06141 TaxID=1828648 RepID=UPI001881DA58|nr:NUDIX hydrolase [Oculatella sp. LEGE 06141]MBE9178134.1 NUDIX hydrolase [Oculatella sp. LEGE 06141]